MREILFSIAPLVVPTAGLLLAFAVVALVAGVCARNPLLQKFLLYTSFAFVLALFVFGCFGVVITLMTIKEAVVAGGL